MKLLLSITQLCTAFDEGALKTKLAEIDKQCETPDFYLNQALAKSLGSKKRYLEDTIKELENNNSSVQYFEELFLIEVEGRRYLK